MEAQEYYKKYTEADGIYYWHHGSIIKVLEDGNTLCVKEAHDTTGNGTTSLAFRKYNNCGQIIWSYNYSLPYKKGISLYKRIEISPGGEPIIAGLGVKNNDGYFFITKFAKDGSHTIWAKEIPDYRGPINNFKVTPSGNVFIGFYSPNNQLGVIKLDSSGNTLNSFDMGNRGSFSYNFFFPFENHFLLSIDSTLTKFDLNGIGSWSASYSHIWHIEDILKTSEGFLITGNNYNNDSCYTFNTNDTGQVTQLGNKFAEISDVKLTSGDGKFFLYGNGITYNNPNSYFYAVFYEIDEIGKARNGFFQQDYNIENFSSLGFHNNSLHYSAHTTYSPQIISFDVLGKMSLDTANLFCKDTIINDTSACPLIQTSYFQPSANYKAVPTTSNNLNLVRTTTSPKFDFECILQRDYSNLFNIDSLIMCKGDYLDITRPEIYGTSFSWSTGDTSEIIRVYQEGPYWVNMTFPCDDSIYTDTVYVTFYPQADSTIIITPNAAELNETIEFTSSSLNDSVFWVFKDGYTTNEFNFSRSFENSGWKSFYVSFFTTDGCETIIHDSTLVLFQEVSIPNIFTPNGDGMNDEMFIQGEDIASFELSIFDRWGAQIVELENKYWNGRDKSGNLCHDGVYFYIFNYTVHSGEKLTKKGNVTLMRGTP